LLAFGSLLVLSSSAEAHERRQVLSYTFVVGWLNEPALLNQPNAVDLRVSRTADASPVTGLEQSLKAEVTAGNQKQDVQLRPRFNTPGAYDGRMIPTATGVYSFRINGTIEGAQVNETFTAGPNTFGLIEEGNAFPVPLVSNQELDESLNGLEQRVVELESGGSDDAGTVMAVAIAGVVIGLLGLAVGGYSLTRKAS
jgi:hypothetical protein